MTGVRTGEYLATLQQLLQEDLKIEATRTDTEWGGVFYEFHVYSRYRVIKELQNKRKDELNKNELKEFLRDGAVAVLNCREICTEETIDEAIKGYFAYLFDTTGFNDIYANIGGVEK